MGMIFDVRKATCRGGGGLWAFLSHVRDLQPGGSFELITDDPIAGRDIPAWTSRVRWPLIEIPAGEGALRFVVARPTGPR